MALILSRHHDEAVLLIIPAGLTTPERMIRVFIARVDRGKVQLGIEAPDSIKILREELATEDEMHDVDCA